MIVLDPQSSEDYPTPVLQLAHRSEKASSELILRPRVCYQVHPNLHLPLRLEISNIYLDALAQPRHVRSNRCIATSLTIQLQVSDEPATRGARIKERQ